MLLISKQSFNSIRLDSRKKSLFTDKRDISLLLKVKNFQKDITVLNLFLPINIDSKCTSQIFIEP